MKRRKQKNTHNYQALEPRQLLAAGTSGSRFNFDLATNTLFISAEPTNVESEQFSNDMTLSIDGTDLLIEEANCDDQRFSLTGLNNISYRGTFFADRFINNTSIDTRVVSFRGDDVIVTGGGDDRVIAGNGDDQVTTGDGDDYAAGGQGADTITEDADHTGNDRFFGGPGADMIESSLGDDFLVGGEDDDMIDGGIGNDFVLGGDGIDTVQGGVGRDIIYGGNGNDILSGSFGIDRILGQDGNDEINGDRGNDSLDGGDGNDIIRGGFDNDRIVGGLGSDELFGDSGLDNIVSAVPTTLNENFGVDTVDGGNDNLADVILFHPDDTVVVRPNDIRNSVFDIRGRQNRDFLVANRNQPGWSETASGLQFRHVVVGNGASPVATDRVRVNYVGTYIDGTEFDSNDNVAFFLNGVIAGWTEGLQLMNVGGTIELAIPADLAYGEAGRGNIPGRSTLLFTVDLLAIL